VELNDIGHFRVELDLEENTPSALEFFMEVELMFSDLLNQVNKQPFFLYNLPIFELLMMLGRS